MSTFRVGQRTQVMIADAGNPQAEGKLKQYDANRDGVIDTNEGAALFARDQFGKRPNNLDEVFGLVGGRQHDVKVYDQNLHTMEAYGEPKGNFNIAELGAGNVRGLRGSTYYYNDDAHQAKVETYTLIVDCDLMNKDFIEKGVNNATLIIGPQGFTPEEGSDYGEAVAVPLDIATRDGYQAYSRGGGGNWVPEKKMLGAKLDVADLRALSGGKPLSFYIKLDTDQGPKYINRDGQAFNNFEIHPDELQARTE